MSRIACGVVAGPLYLVVGYAQAFTREGFDLSRHPFSMLSLGSLGWIQIANFIVCGALFLVAATGMARRTRWGARLIGLMGAGMVLGGVFVADPAMGFPAGAPDGPPAALSWHGALHAVAFGLAMIGWIGACFVFARTLGGWLAVMSGLTGVLLMVPMAFLGTPGGTVLLYVVATIGWVWTSVVSLKLSRPAFSS
ncbi:DUF998 domain-containing protein [Lentzea flaviverrucosa]|uniref:DUF998 domain-containing protein n=1 Tax=Lentzea flaviverrucosa TaxID=200379 RepID=A0A1H9RXC4_9PSEU|nr:DUF998 domain-containing protein [Lentzea flaviverrucosa]RDI33155.1 uncharacterized protein DUF998 [Lentzea flaviverrucosa]SER76559.1 Protein of unknown function [Lentzea flaviverrucosa]